MSVPGEYIMCYFGENGLNFCVDVYEFGEWKSAYIIPRDRIDDFTFKALGKTFTVHATPESFSVMPTEIRLPPEAYD